jgi:hypothetical protein
MGQSIQPYRIPLEEERQLLGRRHYRFNSILPTTPEEEGLRTRTRHMGGQLNFYLRSSAQSVQDLAPKPAKT